MICIAKFTSPNGTEFFWGPFDTISIAEDYCWQTRDQYLNLGVSDDWKREIIQLNIPGKGGMMTDLKSPTGEQLVQFYKNQRQQELAAISLSWYGYFTTKELPPDAFVIWEKLSLESKSTFRRLADKRLGEGR